MSTSTDGQICYGVVFEEDYEFPWDDEVYNGDFDEWWLVESGWRWNKENPYTPDGEYASGFSKDDPRIDEYYDSRNAWKDAHPAPVELVNYQSGECPAYILAIPSSVLIAHRGYAEVFRPSELVAKDDEAEKLMEFCSKYGLEFEEGPCWLLSSYWG